MALCRRLPSSRRLSSAWIASVLHGAEQRGQHDPCQTRPTAQAFLPQHLVDPNLDTGSVVLPRQFVDSGLPVGYLPRLRAYLDSIGLGQCNAQFIAHALIHPAVVKQWSPDAELALSWKGLAFIGDALIYFLSASYLLQSLDNMTPSSLHCKRFAMVSNEALSRAFTSPSLSLYKHMVVPVKMPPRGLPGVHATAMEAFIGAVYLNQGLQSSFFVERLIPELCHHQTQPSLLDPISRVQVLCQRQYHSRPQYRTLSQTKVGFGLIEFEIGLFVNDQCLQTAIANSLAEARKLVALLALERRVFADDTS